jgi:branched-chain amino acid transport system permease protein
MNYIGIVLGMTFTMLYGSGLISLGISAFYGVGAYSSTLLVMNTGLNFWQALPLSVLITGIIGLGIGSVIIRHPGMTFVVLTLVFNMVIVQMTGQIELFGGWGGIIGISPPSPIGPVEFTTKIPYYYLIMCLSLLTAVCFYSLYTSRFGRAWNAIKLSPNLSEMIGINLYYYRLFAFVVACMPAGAVGSFYAHYFQTVAPEAFGGWSAIYIQLYCVLGGLNFYILGPVIGSTFLTFIPEFLRITKEIEPIVTGILLLIIILFFADGILGTLQKFIRQMKEKRG